MGALFGDITKIGQSTEPDMHGKLVVFDPKVFGRTNKLLTDWSTNRAQWGDTFNKWKSDFNAATPEFQNNVNRENDYLKYLRDGGFEQTLSGIRAKEHQNDLAEQKNALDFAGGSADRARLASGGGSSSADFARRLRTGDRIASDFGARDTARERGDLNWTNQMKLGTMGRINQNLDALVNRQLTPQQLSDSELQTMVHTLGGIQGIRMGSASPVFWRQTGLGEQLAAPLDDALSIATSFYGGKANSAPDNNPTMPATNYGASNEFNSGGTPQGGNAGTGEGGASPYIGGSGSMYNYSRTNNPSNEFYTPANRGVDYNVPSWSDTGGASGFV